MKEAFDLLQVNGKIPKASTSHALRAAGLNPTDSVLSEIIANDLTMDSYFSLVERHQSSVNLGRALKEAFRYFDKDGKNTIARADFDMILAQTDVSLSPEEVKSMLSGSIEENGSVQYDQLIQRLTLAFTKLGNPEDLLD